MDKAITAYGYDMEKHFLESKARATEYRGQTMADMYRRQGRTLAMKGFIGGLTTLVGTGMYAAQRFAPQPSPGKYLGGMGTKLQTRYGYGTTGGSTVYGWRHG